MNSSTRWALPVLMAGGLLACSGNDVQVTQQYVEGSDSTRPPYYDGTPSDGTPSDGTPADQTPTGDDESMPIVVGGNYTLELLVELSDYVTDLERTIAVDGDDQVFVTDGSYVIVIQDGQAYSYINSGELNSVLGTTPYIKGLDVDAAGNVYLLHGGGSGAILISRRQIGVADELADISEIPQAALLGVVEEDNIGVVNHYDGLWQVDGGITLVYDSTELLGGTNCAKEGFAMARDGFFFYVPGCTVEPLLVAGYLDGSGVAPLLTEANLPNDTSTFAGVGRAADGVSLLVNFGDEIAYLGLDGGAVLLDITPSLADLLASGISFEDSPVVEGPTGTLYLISGTAVYRATSN